MVGAITPCGQCRACLSAQWAQCGHGEGIEAIGGWRFGNTINGAQAEYLLVPNAQANLAKIPHELTDEQVVLLADIASTGFSGAESASIRIGDTVVVFAQGPIGLCATAGAKLMGASLIIGVESDPVRMEMSKRMGAHVVLDPKQFDVVAARGRHFGEPLEERCARRQGIILRAHREEIARELPGCVAHLGFGLLAEQNVACKV